MASKRRLSYHWQLFIPFVTTLWVMLVAFAIWETDSRRKAQVEQLRAQLDMVSARVIDAYERDLDMGEFLKFSTDYFRKSPIYKSLRVSIYKDGVRIKNFGDPIALSREEYTRAAGFTPTPGLETVPDPDRTDKDNNFYYTCSPSKDGRVLVYTVVPLDPSIFMMRTETKVFLLVLLFVTIVLTIFAYFSTRYFGRNIKILHKLAVTAAENKPLQQQDFPHDELGDISRQIVELHNQRILAFERSEQEHAVALNAIEERARNKRQLTNNINHELRTPIGVIKGYLDTIIENPDMDSSSRMHFIRKAQEHVNRLVNLIADVSSITRLEEGAEMISTEELNFHDLAYTVANDLKESGALKGMTFELKIPVECRVEGNYNLLTGVLNNLAKNAANYSKGTTVTLEQLGEDKHSYTFSFRDDGVGVKDEHLPHLFERFYRIDSGRARKAGGTGLGLPIVHNTIVAHGGSIEVRNRKDGLSGLEFVFTLPKA